MFRYKRSARVPYNRQGYIYFVSLLYGEMPRSRQAVIRELCRRAGGPYDAAVLDYVTTDMGAEAVCGKHHISRATLARCVARYYEGFPDWL